MKYLRNSCLSAAITAVLLLSMPLGAETPVPLDRAAAFAAAREGNWTLAEPALAALVTGEPVDVEACCVLAQRKISVKESKEAVRLMERATEAQPNRAELHALLGQALGHRIGEVNFMQQGMLSAKLRRAFARAVELEPNNLTGLIGLAYFHLNAPDFAGGSSDKASEYADRVAAVEPFNGALLHGEICVRGERWSEAAIHFRVAVVIKPGEAWLHVKLGEVCHRGGQSVEARRAFEAALRLQPDLPAALVGIESLGTIAE